MPQELIEEWRPVGGTNNAYEVSNLGRVRSITRMVFQKGTYGGWKILKGSILKPTGRDGTYKAVALNINGRRKKVRVHRLVAEVFIPNTENKRCIDHIDGNKNNNAVSNLRWVTHKENSNNWATKKKICRSVLQVDPVTGETIKVWPSITIAREETKIKSISKCCRHIIKHTGGYKWEYANETENN